MVKMFNENITITILCIKKRICLFVFTNPHSQLSRSDFFLTLHRFGVRNVGVFILKTKIEFQRLRTNALYSYNDILRNENTHTQNTGYYSNRYTASPICRYHIYLHTYTQK